MQNVFIKLLNYEGKFTDEEHEKAWLLRCAANHCKDILKSAYRKRTEFDLPDVADNQQENNDAGEVYEVVLSLPDKYKDCIYLHYYEGYKTEEIAKILERPASTIRSHLSEARALLREKLAR